MKNLTFALTLSVTIGLFVTNVQSQTNPITSGNTAPINVQLSVPEAVAVTNILTFKPDDETQKLLRNVSASFAARPIIIQLDSQSLTQLTQLSSKLIAIELDEKTLARLEPRPEPWWKNALPFLSTLLGAGIALFASYWATTHSHNLQIRRQKEQNAVFVINVLKSIEAELDSLNGIFNQGIGKQLKAKTGRMFLVRLALTQDYFTVFGANAIHLEKIKPDTARAIIFLYQTLKQLIENFRINNEYIQMHDAVMYQWQTTFAVRPEGLANRAKELETLLDQQGDELVRLAGVAETQYLALKETFNQPNMGQTI